MYDDEEEEEWEEEEEEYDHTYNWISKNGYM